MICSYLLPPYRQQLLSSSMCLGARNSITKCSYCENPLSGHVSMVQEFDMPRGVFRRELHVVRCNQLGMVLYISETDLRLVHTSFHIHLR